MTANLIRGLLMDVVRSVVLPATEKAGEEGDGEGFMSANGKGLEEMAKKEMRLGDNSKRQKSLDAGGNTDFLLAAGGRFRVLGDFVAFPGSEAIAPSLPQRPK